MPVFPVPICPSTIVPVLTDAMNIVLTFLHCLGMVNVSLAEMHIVHKNRGPTKFIFKFRVDDAWFLLALVLE